MDWADALKQSNLAIFVNGISMNIAKSLRLVEFFHHLWMWNGEDFPCHASVLEGVSHDLFGHRGALNFEANGADTGPGTISVE